MLYLPCEFDNILINYSQINLQLFNIFCFTNLSSLKRKSTTIAKRQSFMLETKPLALKKPKTVLSDVSSKRLHAHVNVVTFMFLFM